MAQLPMEIVNIIQEMACTRQSNKKSGRDFMICCCSKKKSDGFTTIENWLLSRLDLIKHPAVSDGKEYYWNIVVNSKVEDELLYIGFLIHLSSPPKKTPTLIIMDETYKYYEMSAEYLLEHLAAEPEYVIGIGVSAVSPEYMCKEWWKAINNVGRGYRFSPMWEHTSTGWAVERENSCTFGWENYPPLAILNDFCTLEQRFKQTLRHHYRRLENILISIERQIDMKY